jgi:hypothetical protein
MSRPAHDTAVLDEIRELIEEEQALHDLGLLDDDARHRLEVLKERLDRTSDFLRHRRAYLAFLGAFQPSLSVGQFGQEMHFN